MDLPKILESSLQAILDSSTLQSWNIFQEQNGHIIVKLKFNGHHNQAQQTTAYRKKSQRQSDRDNQRATVWNSRKRATDHQSAEYDLNPPKALTQSSEISHAKHPVKWSTPQSDSTGMITRSMDAKETLEILRDDKVGDYFPNPAVESFIVAEQSPPSPTWSSPKLESEQSLRLRCPNEFDQPEVTDDYCDDHIFDDTDPDVGMDYTSPHSPTAHQNNNCEFREKQNAAEPMDMTDFSVIMDELRLMREEMTCGYNDVTCSVRAAAASFGT